MKNGIKPELSCCHWTSIKAHAQISGFPAPAPRDHSGFILLSFPASARHIPEAGRRTQRLEELRKNLTDVNVYTECLFPKSGKQEA